MTKWSGCLVCLPARTADGRAKINMAPGQCTLGSQWVHANIPCAVLLQNTSSSLARCPRSLRSCPCQVPPIFPPVTQQGTGYTDITCWIDSFPTAHTARSLEPRTYLRAVSTPTLVSLHSLCRENTLCLYFKSRSGQLLAKNSLELVRTTRNMVGKTSCSYILIWNTVISVFNP